VKFKVYYILLVLYSSILADLSQAIFFKIGRISIHYVDAINFLVLLLAFNHVRRFGFKLFTKASSLLIIYLIWLTLEVARGLTIYGLSAIGESRNVVYPFMCFIPFFLFDVNKRIDKRDVYNVVETTIFIGGVSAFVIFIIEIINGGRFFLSKVNTVEFSNLTDYRGVRYLDVYHSYNLLLMSIYLILKMSYKRKFNKKDIFIASLLTISSIVAKDRTPIISLSIALVAYLLLQRKAKMLVYILFTSLIILTCFVVFDAEAVHDYYTIFTGALSFLQNPYNDPTGTALWRYQVDLAAIGQALKTLWFGQGYGGYYYFGIKGFSLEEATTIPHNLYVVILLKSGLIGLIIFALFLFMFLLELIKTQNKNKHDESYLLFMGTFFIIIFSQLLYGMGYTYISTLGLYSGFAFLLIHLQQKSTSTLKTVK